MGDWDYADLVRRQREHFRTGATMALAARRTALAQLRSALRKWESPILAALRSDLGKSTIDAYAGEIGVVLGEIDYAIRRLPRWTKPRKCPGPWAAWPSRAMVVRQPLGVALILAPWNYPVQLLLNPLVGAIAGANCAVIKPSELAPRTAKVMRDMIAGTFAEEHICCVLGDKRAAEGLLREKFDTIFFTGGAAVGRRVMAAAAEHLTPVTLELGGKCPCIVTERTRLEVAARRIIWGKMLNAGQTCVAPDFVYVQRPVRDAFLAACKRAIESFYGADPRQSPHYGRIVNQAHFRRLLAYLPDGDTCTGGPPDEADLYIAPTILTGVPLSAPVMQEEIFGPILPVLAFDSIEEVFSGLRNRPAPLAIYLFSTDRALQARVMRELPAGGVCVNDLLVQLFAKQLPFGGVGASGMGAYHGRAGFECFTHAKSMLRCSTAFDPAYRYPPPRLSLDKFRRVLAFLLSR